MQHIDLPEHKNSNKNRTPPSHHQKRVKDKKVYKPHFPSEFGGFSLEKVGDQEQRSSPKVQVKPWLPNKVRKPARFGDAMVGPLLFAAVRKSWEDQCESEKRSWGVSRWSLFGNLRGAISVVTGASIGQGHQTKASTKYRQKWSKKCPKIMFSAALDNYWTFFGHFSTFFRDFSAILSTFRFCGLSNYLPVTTLVPISRCLCPFGVAILRYNCYSSLLIATNRY